MPARQWNRNQKIIEEFDIKDSALYHLIFVIRHTAKFQFASILTTLEIKNATQNTKSFVLKNLNIPLTDTNGNWTGDKMDDLYYHRIKINPPVLLKSGKYQIILQHEMNEKSLPHILNIGAAIEKTVTSQ
jgi:gliding motility-associated lipoprotein GldH